MNRKMLRECSDTEKGFTMIEAVITIAVVVILAAILIPLVSQNINSARFARASSEVNTIGKAIFQFRQDMAVWPLYAGASPRRLLFGDTDNDNNGVPGNTTLPAGWDTIPVGQRLSLYYNLIENRNGYSGPSARSGVSWNGPYLQEIHPDPWGNPYLVNSEWLYTSTTPPNNVYVLSAGPGRPPTVETAFTGNMPAGSDDIIFRLQ